jgi:ribonuclease E
MRSMKHRKAIEERFTNHFKRDRARTTIAPISEFGILEMTRQRMRPSLRKAHFMDCPHCNGHGEIKVPESVAADAVRHVGFLLQYDRVHRVEVACSPRVASVLLSGKRRDLVRMEDQSDKRVEVRVSESIAMDRVDFYAYDDRNADIDISRLPSLRAPAIEDLEKEQDEPSVVEGSEAAEGEDSAGGRRRRRRRGKRGPADATAIALAGDFDEELEALGYDEDEDEVVAGEEGDAHEAVAHGSGARGSPDRQHPDAASAGHGEMEPGEGKRRRRRRRGGRRRRKNRGLDAQAQPFVHEGTPLATHDDVAAAATADGALAAEHSLRVHELARELNVPASEVIQRAENDPAVHDFHSPLATVSPAEADTIRQMFGQTSGSVDDGDHPAAVGGRGVAAALGLPESAPGQPGEGGGGKRRRRRRRRGGKGRNGQGATGGGPASPAETSGRPVEPSLLVDNGQLEDGDNESGSMVEQSEPGETAGQPGGSGKRRRRRRRRRGGGGADAGGKDHGASMTNDNASGQVSGQRAGLTSAELTDARESPGNAASSSSGANTPASAPARRPRRALYRAGRGPVSTRAREAGGEDE